MDENAKKNAIVKAMTEVECYPIVLEETMMQEYTPIPIMKMFISV